jgi:ubiquinone/menaquinone biosynthesis C-methylase UbiE
VTSLEIAALILLVALYFVFVVGSIGLKTPRKTSFQGIEDPDAAEEYDRISRTPPFRLIRRRFVGKLKKYTTEGTIADVGCGPGYLLQLIAKEYPTIKLVGVDISRTMLERAKANFGSMGLAGRAEFREGSADHLPFEDQTQDVIVSTLSLHHWADPKAAFNEIHRVLKPGGKMLILDLMRDAPRMFFWVLWFAQNVAFRIIGMKAMRRAGEPTGSLFASYTSQEIREIVSKTNFSNLKIETELGFVYVYGIKGTVKTEGVAT